MIHHPFDRHLVSRIRNRIGLPLSGHRDFVGRVASRHGLEVGGPSDFFMNRLPVYKAAHAVDQLNFSTETVWSSPDAGNPRDQMPALKNGRTIICDGTNLQSIADAKYDFLLSCHSLEHIANPMKALAEWTRVIRPAGHLLLIVPSKTGNFDHRRPDTTFEHLMDDLRHDVDERDMTHLEEILALHDLTRDPLAGDLDQFKARSLLNFENRCLHHHVFSLPLIFKVMQHLGLSVRQHTTTASEFVVIGQKS